MSTLLPTSSDIVELHYRQARLSQCQMNWWRRHGVSTTAMCEPSPIFFAKIALQNGGVFDFVTVEEEGTRAFVVMVNDEFGEPADICAWCPRMRRPALWLGAVCMLGQDEVNAPTLGEPLRIFRNPLGWLRAERRGVVLIDHRSAARQLEGISLEAEDAAHAAELRRALARPAPKITWRRNAEAAE